MRKIDLKLIIENNELEVNEVALHLFPENKHPRLALNRVIAGDSLLDADQISKLSSMVGIPISGLFSGGDWKGKVKDNHHIFTNGDFEAHLNMRSGKTTILHKGTMYHESMIHSTMIPLSEYIKQLELIIKKSKK